MKFGAQTARKATSMPVRTARLAGLMATTALIVPAIALPAFAQVTIDNGDTVTVPSPEQSSPWEIGDELNVHTGELIISESGTVSATVSNIGFQSGSYGSATVTGRGSTLRNSGRLVVGYLGVGELTVEDGGTVYSHRGDIAWLNGSVGTVLVIGEGSAWINTGVLYVAPDGVGQLTIADGGAVSNPRSFIGFNDVSKGTVTVNGHASLWSNEYDVEVGRYGSGTLTIAEGGTVSAGRDFYIARYGNSVGRLFIGAGLDEDGALLDPVSAGILNANSVAFGVGDGQLVFNHTGNPDGSAHEFGAGMSGDGTITHLAGETRLTGDSDGFSGTTNVTGGNLWVENGLGGQITVENGATLGGSGTVGATEVADGGILAPGSSIGTLTVDGDLTLNSGAVLNYELGAPGVAIGSGTSDRIEVNGDLTLNGTLNLAQSADVADGDAGIGYYRLMSYQGLAADHGLELGTTFIATDHELLVGDTALDLLIGTTGDDDELQHWQGGDGAWNSSDARWLNSDGELPVTWAGHHAVFKDEPGGFDGGTIRVEGNQGFEGIQFVDSFYVLEGPGSLVTDADGSEVRVLADETAGIATEIAGAGALAITGGGTLTLSGDNNYQGGTHIVGTRLEIDHDRNLGDAGGGLDLSRGGTLAIATSFDSARTVGLTGRGVFDVASGTTLGLTGVVSGDGDLLLDGGGTLVLSGDNDYGNTLVQSGSLIGDAASISGSIANAGTVTFNQTSDADFAGEIGGYGGDSGQMILTGGGTLVLDGRSTLNWTVEDGELVSASDRLSGDVDIADTAGFTFDQDTDGAYDGVLSGGGTLTVTGDGAVELTGDSSGFAGVTNVDGTLMVNDHLGGSALIGQDGLLGGSGTIGSGVGSTVTLGSGSTLAPGNSIGTLTIDGDLVIASGSRFEVEVAPEGSDADLVAVTGTATLDGGTVAHIGASGNYDLRSTYTILSADTGLSGAFDDVTSAFAFLTPDLVYDYGAGTVDLSLVRNDTDFASVALTANQTATAEGIESIGMASGSPVYDAIAQMGDDEAVIRTSFDQLSGEIHASLQTGLIEDTRHIRTAVDDRLRAAFDGIGAAPSPVLAYGPDGPTLAPADESLGLTAWGTAYGSWGTTDSDGNAASIDRNTGGVLVGADTMIDHWRLGLLAGYSRSSIDAADRAASADVDSYRLGIYGGSQWDMDQGVLALRGGLAYSWHDIATSRAVGFTGFAPETLSSSYDAGSFQAFGQLGYGVETEFARFEPFANLAHVSLRTDGFTETGGAAALTGASGSTNVTFSTLGLRAGTDIDLGQIQGRLNGMVGWRHAFGDTNPESVHALSGSDTFSIGGSPIANNALVLEAGFDLDLPSDATFGLSYQGQIAAEAQDHGFRVNLAIRF